MRPMVRATYTENRVYDVSTHLDGHPTCFFHRRVDKPTGSRASWMRRRQDERPQRRSHEQGPLPTSPPLGVQPVSPLWPCVVCRLPWALYPVLPRTPHSLPSVPLSAFHVSLRAVQSKLPFPHSSPCRIESIGGQLLVLLFRCVSHLLLSQQTGDGRARRHVCSRTGHLITPAARIMRGARGAAGSPLVGDAPSSHNLRLLSPSSRRLVPAFWVCDTLEPSRWVQMHGSVVANRCSNQSGRMLGCPPGRVLPTTADRSRPPILSIDVGAVSQTLKILTHGARARHSSMLLASGVLMCWALRPAVDCSMHATLTSLLPSQACGCAGACSVRPRPSCSEQPGTLE